MSQKLTTQPEYNHTIRDLEEIKHTANSGIEYWCAREILSVLGYEEWRSFEGVVDRTRSSMTSNDVNPSHHIVETTKLIVAGNGAERNVIDYLLSRAACYLIAINGDPKKPAIAAAQAYFATQTRIRELETEQSDDEKRLEQRAKVTESFKAASSAAKQAGVPGQKQSLFHNARYEGLYNLTSKAYRASKGIDQKENAFDRMGTLELSANDFQMNLAAEKITQEQIRGETRAINANKEIAKRVRKTMWDSGVQPENLPIEEPIKDVRKRLNAERPDKQIGKGKF